uniref:Protoporphyrinogen oxidase n=1 Tax=Strigomonas galati TaxID=1003336 RepID=G1C9P8_9TRYP|nr:protoporphyrinogen oxidase [Strigomonas galati]
MKYLILFYTTDGHTKVVAEAIAEEIRTKDAAAECTIEDLKVFMKRHPQTAEGIADMKQYDKVILGASVRYGYFAQEVHQFTQRYTAYLNSVTTGFFSVNMVARKPNKRTPETNPYTRKFLGSCPWRPTKIGVFAGALYYPRYSSFDRNMTRFIMKMTGGDTDPLLEKVYTDWDSVKAFTGEVVAMTAADIPAAQARGAEIAKAAAAVERRRRLFRLSFLGVAAGVAAVTMALRRRKLTS